MGDEQRPRATPEQATHLLRDLKIMYAAGQIKVTEFTITDPAYQPKKTTEDDAE